MCPCLGSRFCILNHLISRVHCLAKNFRSPCEISKGVVSTVLMCCNEKEASLMVFMLWALQRTSRSDVRIPTAMVRSVAQQLPVRKKEQRLGLSEKAQSRLQMDWRTSIKWNTHSPPVAMFSHGKAKAPGVKLPGLQRRWSEPKQNQARGVLISPVSMVTRSVSFYYTRAYRKRDNSQCSLLKSHAPIWVKLV